MIMVAGPVEETAMSARGLSEEQRLMRQSCRDFVDDVVIPFIRGNWQREWSMVPEERLPPEILAEALDGRAGPAVWPAVFCSVVAEQAFGAVEIARISAMDSTAAG